MTNARVLEIILQGRSGSSYGRFGHMTMDYCVEFDRRRVKKPDPPRVFVQVENTLCGLHWREVHGRKDLIRRARSMLRRKLAKRER